MPGWRVSRNMSSLRRAFSRLFTSPRMMAALSVVAIGGATAGMTIGGSPMVMKGVGGADPLAGNGSAPASDAYRPQAPQPDHYPLVTPTGTVPVAELALRGHLRNSRSSWYREEPDYVLRTDDFPDQYSDDELAQLAAFDSAPEYRSEQRNMRASQVTIHRGREAEQLRESTPAPVAAHSETPAARPQDAPVQIVVPPAKAPVDEPGIAPQPTLN